MTIGQIQTFLRERREALALTQGDIAAQLDMKQHDVSRLESPGYRPTLATLMRWAKALGCEVEVKVK